MSTEPGQPVQVRLVANAFPDIHNARVTVTFNPEQLTFINAQPGNFFPADADHSPLAVSVSPAAGTIILKVGQDHATAKGTGVLAVLTFTAKSQGQAPLIVEQPTVTDASGQTVSVMAQHGLIRIL